MLFSILKLGLFNDLQLHISHLKFSRPLSAVVAQLPWYRCPLVNLADSFERKPLGDCGCLIFDLLSANPTKWSNTLKQFVGKSTTNCLGAFEHFIGLALKVACVVDIKLFFYGLILL